jgi:hypothetical protein
VRVWGAVKLEIDGTYRRYQLTVFTSAYSHYRFAMCYIRQDTLSFKEAHILFFDNIVGAEPLVSVPMAFLQYRRRKRKGHVERSVEYIRRKAFAFKDEFASLQAVTMQHSVRPCCTVY